jgi:glycosyltransferase involved in cell wall biosynthesis
VSAFRPLPLAGERALILAFDPHLLAANVEQAEEILVVGSECLLVGSETEPGRISFASLLSPIPCRELRDFAPTVAVVNTLRGAWAGPIVAAARYGVTRFVLVDAPGSFFLVNARGAAVLSTKRVLRRSLALLPQAERLERYLGQRFDPPWPSLESAHAAADSVAAHAKPLQREPLPQGKLRIVHFLGTLSPGGAERQLTYLAEATRARGHEVEVWISHSLEGANGHYAPRLEQLGVKVRVLPNRRRTSLRPHGLERLGLSKAAVRNLEEHVAAATLIPLIQWLQEDPPDVLHCWLDQTNVVGALAGLASGLRRVVISARNVSPLHVPRLLEPWFQHTYRVLFAAPRLTCVANSHAGADDYAAWSQSERAEWKVVTNGFDIASLTPLGPEERVARRAALGVGPEDFLLVGVFRLAEEKRPDDFLDMLELLRQRIPRLRVIHVGSGYLGPETKSRAERMGLDSVLSFAGRRDDPWEILSAADASVLTSEIEGLPNVSLESQALEVPIVLTRAGGAPESVDDGVTGFVCEIGDVEAISARLEQLAGDPELRRSMGAAGRKWVAESFSLEAMIEGSLALYE